MNRSEIFAAIDGERTYQNSKWGDSFDNLNTKNDWIAYIASYAGKAVSFDQDNETFRRNLLKVAALCVAALERDEYAPRHYDGKKV